MQRPDSNFHARQKSGAASHGPETLIKCAENIEMRYEQKPAAKSAHAPKSRASSVTRATTAMAYVSRPRDSPAKPRTKSSAAQQEIVITDEERPGELPRGQSQAASRNKGFFQSKKKQLQSAVNSSAKT